MQLFSFNGLVLRSIPIGENDKLIIILSDEYGKISVLAKGARKVGSKFFSACSLFAYGSFTVGKSRDMNYLREYDIKETFYSIASADLKSYAVMTYIAQICEDVATNEAEHDLLSLTLNAMYLLGQNKKSAELVKAVFEFKCACLCGFTPDISGCRMCKKIKSEQFLEVMNGTLICSECKNSMSAEQIQLENDGVQYLILPTTSGVIKALEYIIFSPIKKVFSFNIIGTDASLFYSLCEKYLLNHLERTFPALDYYYSVADI